MAMPTTLPWPAVAILMSTILGAAGLAALLDPAAALPAVFGALAGLGGAFLTPKGQETAPFLAGLAAMALLLPAPPQWVLWLVMLLLCLGTGWEAVRSGGRAALMALYAWLALILVQSMPPPATAVPAAAAGLLAGWAIAHATGLAGKAARPAAPPVFGLSLALYLALGLSFAVLMMQHLQSPFAHWIALVFVMRALAPPGQTQRATLRFGAGAGLGCILGMGLIALHLPHALTLALALLLLVAALRLIPHPWPFTPAAVSAAVLLLVAHDIRPALFRLEVTALVVLLSLALSAALGLLLDEKLEKRLRRWAAG